MMKKLAETDKFIKLDKIKEKMEIRKKLREDSLSRGRWNAAYNVSLYIMFIFMINQYTDQLESEPEL